MKNTCIFTKALFILVFTLINQQATFAQSGWNLLDPYPTNAGLSDVSFINATTGWIAGGSGLVLKTTDGGDNWTMENTNTTRYLYGVHFTDAQHGWIADITGGISATTDGGTTWSPQASPSSLYFYAMQFTDANHGFVLLEYDSLLYTTNGGTTWNRIKIDTVEYHYGMKFVSPTEGWICGSNGQILHSLNGGLNWSVQNSGTTLDLNTIDFTDNLHGWAAGYTSSSQGIVLHTSDGGAHWNILLQNFNDNLTKISFNDTLNGYAVSSGAVIYRTTDGGTSWTPAYTSPHEALYDVQVLSSGTGFVCGSNGAILKSTDNGSTWLPKYNTATHGYTISDLSFPDEKNGWVLGFELNHTTDSGKTWVDQSPFSSSFTGAAICFTDSSRGWIVGEWPAGGYGQILRTTDGGATFNFQLNTGIYPFVSVNFSDSLHGIAGTNNKMIYYTADGGTTWDSSTVPAPGNYLQAKKVLLADNSTGYAILSYVANTALAKTTDGGHSWAVIKRDTTQFTAAYTALSFVDAQHGYLAAFNFNGTPNKFSLLKTNDGGNSWTPVTFPANLPGNIGTTQINALHFDDMQHGWVAGGGTNSFILYTDDGGATWSVQELGTSVSWYTLQFINAHTGFAAGWQGDIVKTSTGGLIGVDELSQDAENELVVFPNPASSSVVIRYPVDARQKTELTVYDLTGKICYTGRMSNPEFRFNLSTIPNGIYVVKVSTGKHSVTKRLIVNR